MEEPRLMPPDREPPRRPSLVPLPAVPQMPDELSLSVEPSRAWFTTLGGISKHVVSNHSTDRLAIKVRCSNNHIFRVNPVFVFLDRGQSHEFEVIRLQGGESRKDKIQLLFTLSRDDDLHPEQLFGRQAKIRSAVLPVVTI